MKEYFGKYWVLIAAVCVGACIGETDKRVVYDEAALKAFVLSSRGSANDLDSLLRKASADSAVFMQTVAYLETPFGSPNSAYRNDSLYSVLLRAKSRSAWVDTVFRRKAQERIKLLQQNLPSSIANDFVYETPSGYSRKLHELKAKYTLLFFYNPECPACVEMKSSLASSVVISDKIKSKELVVLAIYTDKDERVWLDHLDEMPAEWVHGRDKDGVLYKDGVYDLRAIPTLYLLNAEKRVVLKDVLEVGRVEKRVGR